MEDNSPSFSRACALSLFVHVPALRVCRPRRACIIVPCVVCACIVADKNMKWLARVQFSCYVTCAGSALLLRLHALSKPSRPASRGGSPLRQDLAAPVRPKGSPPALSFHNDHLTLADYPPLIQ